jgi:hypothetical protein
MAGEFLYIHEFSKRDGQTPAHYGASEKPRTAIELGVVAGDTIRRKLEERVPISPVILETARTSDGFVEIPQTDVNLGLGIALEATTDYGDVTIDGVVGAIKRFVGDTGVVHVSAITTLDDYSPEELSRLTPTHPQVVELGCHPPVPAIRISVEPVVPMQAQDIDPAIYPAY